MYGIYRLSISSLTPTHLVAACYTKRGARKACQYLTDLYENQPGAKYTVRYEKIDHYGILKIGYNILKFERWNETRKLAKLSGKAYEEQQKKVAALY